MTRYSFKVNHFLVKVNLDPQVLSLEATRTARWDRKPLVFLDDSPSQPDVFPFVSIEKAAKYSSTVPLMAFAQKAKQFNDWLYATLDQAAFLGDCPVIGKRDLVQQLAQQIPATDHQLEVKAFLTAAASLGSGSSHEELPWKLRLRVKKLLKSFDMDSLKSKPIGLYSKTETLQNLFRHDRFLQHELKGEEVEPLAQALRQEDYLTTAYDWHLRLNERLTGAHSILPVTSPRIAGARYSLFPPSKSPEAGLIQKLYGNSPIPENFVLLDEVIARIQTNQISLNPSREDGWYLRELYALEAFLKLDNQRCLIGEHYCDALENLFKGLMSLSRETHIKQLELPTPGSAMRKRPKISIRPRLRLEPFPEYYLRMANNYSWLLSLLTDLWGEDFLQTLVCDWHGHQVSVSDALWEMYALFKGAYFLCLEDLGELEPEDSEENRALTMLSARKFLTNWRHDPDMPADCRMMVPLYFDQEKKRTRVSVVCGYASRKVQATFAQKPDVAVTDLQGNRVSPEISWKSTGYDTVYPIQFECEVASVLDRDSFRAIADQHPNLEELRAALENLS